MQCAICGKHKDIYDLTLKCCFSCRRKIDEQKERDKINQTIKEFEEKKNMKYKNANCEIPTPHGFGEQKGWICPVCGRGLAPHMDWCPCKGSEMQITYGTGLGATDTIPYTNLDTKGFEKYATTNCEGLKL